MKVFNILKMFIGDDGRKFCLTELLEILGIHAGAEFFINALHAISVLLKGPFVYRSQPLINFSYMMF